MYFLSWVDLATSHQRQKGQYWVKPSISWWSLNCKGWALVFVKPYNVSLALYRSPGYRVHWWMVLTPSLVAQFSLSMAELTFHKSSYSLLPDPLWQHGLQTQPRHSCREKNRLHPNWTETTVKPTPFAFRIRPTLPISALTLPKAIFPPSVKIIPSSP